jgi:hypothetical protein
MWFLFPWNPEIRYICLGIGGIAIDVTEDGEEDGKETSEGFSRRKSRKRTPARFWSCLSAAERAARSSSAAMAARGIAN